VKTISNPQNKKEAEFAKMQEACRKDIERAFGVCKLTGEAEGDHIFLQRSSAPHKRYGVLAFPPRKQHVRPFVGAGELTDLLHFFANG
jgi:hypothetical protein